MPTLADPISFARTQSQTDSNGLTDANGIKFGNEALNDFRRRLVAGGVDAGQIQEFVQEGTVNVGKYSYPTNPSMLWLKTIELNYSGGGTSNFKVANQLDVANIPGGHSVGWVRINATTNSPWFDDRGDEYEIFPTPTGSHNVTSIITLFYYQKPAEFTATSDSLEYPETLDIRILGWRIASNYLYSLGKILEGDAFNLKYEERVKQLIATLSRGSQQPIQAQGLGLTGWEF